MASDFAQALISILLAFVGITILFSGFDDDDNGDGGDGGLMQPVFTPT